MAMGDYRRQFVQQLVKSERLNCTFYVGEEYFKKSVRTDAEILATNRVKMVRNIYAFSRGVGFQIIKPWKVLQPDLVVIEYNPRVLTNWVWIIVRRVARKRTLGWGHVWPRKGPESKTAFLRKIMLRMMDGLIVYTEQQKKEAESSGGCAGKKVYVAPNALYSASFVRSICKPQITPEFRRDIISVGRLVAEKKPFVLINAFNEFLKNCDSDSRLHLVGDGPLREALSSRVDELGLRGRVRFHGHVSDPGVLAGLYAVSAVSVVPGFAGLSVTQSLIFGCPVLVSKNEDHAPEVVLLDDDRSRSQYFDTDNEAALAKLIEAYVQNESLTEADREAIVDYALDKFSVDAMTEGFLSAVEGCLADASR
ncbi:hypothetical protein DEH80_16600 [Abyssibacter profundi]|uniref:Glycosyl transferase family 1 domain-containing protein n=2 Tax=Abyssibacter profundi TaxID=2182787 RepID=A0A383XPM6_9GAMM|nr:hypothetical protein DEH80_16600 [Abyssibacter profundi]